MIKETELDKIVADIFIDVTNNFSYANFSDLEIYNMIKEESKSSSILAKKQILERIYSRCYEKMRERIVNKDYQDLNRYISNNLNGSVNLEQFNKFNALLNKFGKCITVEVYRH